MKRGCAFLLLALAGCPGPQPPPPSTDVSLEMPPHGFQLLATPFEVPAGSEVQNCYFFTVPGTGSDPIWINRTVAALNTGSHHMNVFRVKTVVNLTGKNGDVVPGGECWKSANWADWPLVVNNQDSVPGNNKIDWTLPSGVAHKFIPGELLMLQIHFVNATTQKTPGRGKGIVNFYQYGGAATPMELGTVFATDQNIRVCPGDTGKPFTQTCKFAKTPVTIIGANGHFHSRGTRFDIGLVDAMNNPMGSAFYTSTSWNDPPFMNNLNQAVPQGGGVSWTCTYDYAKPPVACADAKNNCTPVAAGCSDASSTCCISFGGHVEQQEHCNAFVYYYPKIDNYSCN